MSATGARLASLPALGLLATLVNHACFFEPVGVPDPPELQLSVRPIKQFEFSWSPAPHAEYYQLLERVDPDGEYVQIGDNVTGESLSLTVPLHLRFDTSYVLRACNSNGCKDSTEIVPADVAGTLAEGIGYFKASNPGAEDNFGAAMALSGDGNTLAIGAPWEDSSARGVNGDPASEGALNAGAVYVFVRSGSTWSQQAYVKASNAAADDGFGSSLALSSDGALLAVGAPFEDSAAAGVNVPGAGQDDDSADRAGAVYVFRREGDTWSQEAYVKASDPAPLNFFGISLAISGDGQTLAVGAGGQDAPDIPGSVYIFGRDGTSAWIERKKIEASNPDAGDAFGNSVALSDDGKTLAVGAWGEDSAAISVDKGAAWEADNSAGNSGAVYAFALTEEGWIQEGYIKASNTGAGDWFGLPVALSGDGDTLAVGAYGEDGSATGVDGTDDDAAPLAGAVHLFSRKNGKWQHRAYIKASNTAADSRFGSSVALSDDGGMLAVGATLESGGALGIGGDGTDKSRSQSGAAYLFMQKNDAWSQTAYLKASNADAEDIFGYAVALSGDGTSLAVAATWEGSAAVLIDGDQANNSTPGSGAVYVY